MSKFTAYPDYNSNRCYNAEDKDAADLCAQWRAAIAAEKAAHESRRSATWSIIATFLSALSLLAVAAALYLTIEANSISRMIGKRQLRPYLSLILVQCDITPGEVGGALLIQPHFTIKNFGQTPAEDLKIRAYSTIEHESAKIDWAKLVALDEPAQGLPPQEAASFRLPKKEIVAGLSVLGGEGKVRLHGELTYLDGFNDRHTEWFSFEFRELPDLSQPFGFYSNYMFSRGGGTVVGQT